MRSLLKQISWLVLAQILTRIIGFFYTIFLAKNLGVADFGIYSLGLAYFSIISSLTDFGFNIFLVREITKEKAKQWELLWNISLLRLTLICIFFAAFAVFLYKFDHDKIRVSVILLASLAVLPQAIAITFDGIFIALQKLKFSALAIFLGSASIAVLGFILVTNGFGVFGAVGAVIFGQIVFALVLFLLLVKREGLEISAIKLPVIKKAVAGSLPYGLLAVLGLLYFRVDTILLSYMKGNFEAGIYSAGYKFLEVLIFIPNALGFALFPKFVRFHQENPKTLIILTIKSTKFMFALGILVTLSYYFILPTIVEALLPSYIPAISVIKILALAIPFIFIYVPLSQMILATEKYLKQLIVLSISTLIFNIILNLLFIPKFGFIGASIVTVLSDILSFAVMILFIYIKSFKKKF